MRINKKMMITICMIIVFFLTGNVYSALTDNLDGTITQTRNDGSILMWLEDANYAQTSGYNSDGKMTWYEANDWIQSLNDIYYLGYNNWRLPDIRPANGTTFNEVRGYDGTNDRGFNITRTSSEMSYMYYVELGNLAPVDTSNNPQTGYGLLTTGLFSNIQTDQLYWSGTTNPASTENAWDYFFDRGDQGMSGKTGNEYVWLVRDVTVVPEPISSILFITGGSFFAGRHYIKRKNRA